MYIGLDVKTNELVTIDEAKKDKLYICPHCSSKLIQKRGTYNVWHFAHESLKDCDSWASEMSEWHKHWQELFPKENREVDIIYNNIKHRADVCINGYVIEFQHSSMSSTEFDKRNDFYTRAGYKVLWIFDLMKQYERGQLFFTGVDKIGVHKWKEYFEWRHIYHTFDNFIPQNHDNIILFFQLKKKTNEVCMLNRVHASSTYAMKDQSMFENFTVIHEYSTSHNVGTAINGLISNEYEFVQAVKNKEF